MENIAGTAGVSGAETPRERGSEDRLAAGEGNVSIVGKVWEMQNRSPNPLTQGRAFCILNPTATRRGGVPAPPPRKIVSKTVNVLPANCVYGG